VQFDRLRFGLIQVRKTQLLGRESSERDGSILLPLYRDALLSVILSDDPMVRGCELVERLPPVLAGAFDQIEEPGERELAVGDRGRNRYASSIGKRLAEAPPAMLVPVLLLAAAALAIGFIVNPVTDLGVIPIHWLSKFLGEEPESFNVSIATASSIVALAGIALAYVMYVARRGLAQRAGRRFGAAYTLLSNRYYFDRVYEDVLTVRVLYGRLANATDWIDKSIVDGFFRVVDKTGRNIGRAIALVQTGQLQGYGVAIPIGILVIFGIYVIWR